MGYVLTPQAIPRDHSICWAEARLRSSPWHLDGTRRQLRTGHPMRRIRDATMLYDLDSPDRLSAFQWRRSGPTTGRRIVRG